MRTPTERAALKYLKRAVVHARRANVPLVLVGSYARGKATTGLSDVDVLIVGDEVVDSVPDAVHVVRLSRDQLVERLEQGDDFAQWALRFGVPLTCRKQWTERAEELLRSAPWPSVDRKLRQLGRRVSVVEDLVRMGDGDAAREEVGVALNLASRALLLGAGVFPLSTPELLDQLSAIGENGLATALAEFRAGEIDSAEDVASLLRLIKDRRAGLSTATGASPSSGDVKPR